jgi:tRNA(Arg) A34 adenosine deaminase TadA
VNLDNQKLIGRVLDVIESDIVPLTRQGVAIGDKVFGAAILRKDDLSLVVAGSNHESENPLWHGEVHTLKKFYEIEPERRPATRDCIFIATHEPCSLCLSAITWTGFDNFYFLFGYADTSGVFNIPHDLKILSEVLPPRQGRLRPHQRLLDQPWRNAMIDQLPAAEQAPLRARVGTLEGIYRQLSDTYQASKGASDIPLA